MNLGGNALKFTRSGSVAISVSFDAEAKRVSVVVKDTGIGIKQEDLKLIFEPFRQAEGGSTREFEGTGLGLAIVKSHVERHGGRIRVESKVGQGSTFTLELPVAHEGSGVRLAPSSSPSGIIQVSAPARAPVVATPSAAARAEHSEAVSSVPVARSSGANVTVPGGQGEWIWVIDDEPVNIEVIRARLEMHDYRVKGLPSAVAALEDMRKTGQLPDLILLDIMMPLMSGFEFCERLKSNPEWATIPIIIVSAKNQITDKVYGLTLGAIDYITKPIQKEELLSKIRTFLDLKIGQRMRSELEMASAIQTLFLAGDSVQGESCHFAGRVIPCSETGGDWLGIFDDPQRGITTSVVADVSGHGAPAALMTGLLHGFFSANRNSMTENDPAKWRANVESALLSLNQTILSTAHRKMVQSLLLVCFDHRTKRARYVNAGHPHPVLIQSTGVARTLLLPPSTLLGDMDQPSFSWGEHQFAPSEAFVMYTDGLIECTNTAAKPYGVRRLHHALNSAAGLEAESLRDSTLEDAAKYYGNMPRADDITLLVGRVH